MRKSIKDLSNHVSVISLEEIKRTKAYNALPKLQKLFVDKRQSVQKIHHGFNVSRNIGLEAWLRQSGERPYINAIVEELVKGRV